MHIYIQYIQGVHGEPRTIYTNLLWWFLFVLLSHAFFESKAGGLRFLYHLPRDSAGWWTAQPCSCFGLQLAWYIISHISNRFMVFGHQLQLLCWHYLARSPLPSVERLFSQGWHSSVQPQIQSSVCTSINEWLLFTPSVDSCTTGRGWKNNHRRTNHFHGYRSGMCVFCSNSARTCLHIKLCFYQMSEGQDRRMNWKMGSFPSFGTLGLMCRVFDGTCNKKMCVLAKKIYDFGSFTYHLLVFIYLLPQKKKSYVDYDDFLVSFCFQNIWITSGQVLLKLGESNIKK